MSRAGIVTVLGLFLLTSCSDSPEPTGPGDQVSVQAETEVADLSARGSDERWGSVGTPRFALELEAVGDLTPGSPVQLVWSATARFSTPGGDLTGPA